MLQNSANSVRVQLDDQQQHSMQRTGIEYTTLTAKSASGELETFLLYVQDVVDGVLSGGGVASVVGEGGHLAASASAW